MKSGMKYIELECSVNGRMAWNKPLYISYLDDSDVRQMWRNGVTIIFKKNIATLWAQL